MTVKYYKVGGCVRDKLMGLRPKDIDYSCEASSFDEMKQDILRRGGTIFLEKPEYLTIRAKLNKVDADFVLARKDGQYFDGRRPDSVQPGELIDDLARRDFTINSIAEDEDGNLIDPFNGQRDIDAMIINCVGSAEQRFGEDSLRMLRAIRFSITKGFTLSDDIYDYLLDYPNDILKVSHERIREELYKCFAHNTLQTLKVLDEFRGIRHAIFGGETGIWLQPTSKDK